jgi:hypothetical protein
MACAMIFGKYGDKFSVLLLSGINAPAATFPWHEKPAERRHQQLKENFID